MNQKTKLHHHASRNQKSITQHYQRMQSPKNMGIFSITPFTFYQNSSTQVSKTKIGSPTAFTQTMPCQQPGSAACTSANSRNFGNNTTKLSMRRHTHFSNHPLLSLKDAAATAAATTRVVTRGCHESSEKMQH